MHLGEIIKKYRNEHKISMDEFSSRSGISKAYISLLEKNKHPKTGKAIEPSITCIKQAAKGMNMDFDTLFSHLDGDITVVDNESDLIQSSLMDTTNNILKTLDLDVICQLSDTNITKVNKYAKTLLGVQQMEDEPILMAAHNDNPSPDELKKIKEDMDLLVKPK